MATRLRRALVRGRRADFWFRDTAFLILRHPDGRTTEEIPLVHLRHTDRIEEHVRRLEGKAWVSAAALHELREIAEGAVRT